MYRSQCIVPTLQSYQIEELSSRIIKVLYRTIKLSFFSAAILISLKLTKLKRLGFSEG